jgi:hypothetical protein
MSDNADLLGLFLAGSAAPANTGENGSHISTQHCRKETMGKAESGMQGAKTQLQSIRKLVAPSPVSH